MRINLTKRIPKVTQTNIHKLKQCAGVRVINLRIKSAEDKQLIDESVISDYFLNQQKTRSFDGTSSSTTL